MLETGFSLSLCRNYKLSKQFKLWPSVFQSLEIICSKIKMLFAWNQLFLFLCRNFKIVETFLTSDHQLLKSVEIICLVIKVRLAWNPLLTFFCRNSKLSKKNYVWPSVFQSVEIICSKKMLSLCRNSKLSKLFYVWTSVFAACGNHMFGNQSPLLTIFIEIRTCRNFFYVRLSVFAVSV